MLFRAALCVGVWDSSSSGLRQQVRRHDGGGTWAPAEARASLGLHLTLHGTPNPGRSPSLGLPWKMEGGRSLSEGLRRYQVKLLLLLYFSCFFICLLAPGSFFPLGKQRLNLATLTPVFILLPKSWSLEAPTPRSTGKLDSPEAAEILKTQLQSLDTQHLCTEVLVSVVRLGTPEDRA